MKANNCTVLNENILKVFEFFAKFSSRFFFKLFYAVNNTLMKKLNKLWSEFIVPAAVSYGIIYFFFIFSFQTGECTLQAYTKTKS
ncbi:predicted protein [Methanosarcina acetivorans C2A]|uniref:Uncharacterized protein n=1 Tax=Methanosarcina acetivorans (strain ATCC 35395 / DSM 2834 / JCM 12185 / C2A) TaxID=188937 RepID=Q8TM12_METAC|nr:predicted protein [Methanosarcina acetivorans C2A]